MSQNEFLLFKAYLILLNLAPMLVMHNVIPHAYHYLIIDFATLVPIYIAAKNLRVTLAASKRASGQAIFFLTTAFSALSVFSITLFFQDGNPSDIKSFAYGIHLCILPISVFYAAYCLMPNQATQILHIGCFLNAIAVVYGIFLQVVRPEFYKDYLTIILLEQKGYEYDWQLFARLQSYLGSTTIGSICALSISWINVSGVRANMAVVGTSVFFIGSILSHQRGGFVATVISVAALLISSSQNFKRNIIIVTFLMVTSLTFLAVLNYLHPETFDLLRERSNENLDELFSTRGYGLAYSYIQDFPFGIGLGGSLSASDSAGLASRGQVVDANFMRILVDLGVQGLALFLSLLIISAISATSLEHTIGWLSLLIGFVVIWLGSNTLDNFYVAHIFWLSLGILAAKSNFVKIKTASESTNSA